MPRDAEPPNNRIVQRAENLDDSGTSRDQESLEAQDFPLNRETGGNVSPPQGLAVTTGQ